MIFVAGGAFCQKTPKKIVLDKDFYNTYPSFQISKNYNATNFYHNKNYKSPAETVPLFKPVITGSPVFVIGPDYYTQNFGFFCKKELQFEKVTKVPFKFRLGSVQDCDRMEGKKTAGIIPAY